ncbi:MAG: metallophosphoesterase [Polyangiales bacterium]
MSIPGSFFVGAAFLAVPWSIARGLGFHPWGQWIPLALAAVGLVDSLWAPEDTRDLWLDKEVVPTLRRHAAKGAPDARPLRIVQITDPHLGPFMSVAGLHAICARAVARDPDLVLLTGDLLTMESQRDPAWLTAALAPLKALEGRTFACLGNHDHEALDTVRYALEQTGVTLLVDDMAVAETPAGPVEVLGFDFHFRDRAARMKAVTDRFARADGCRASRCSTTLVRSRTSPSTPPTSCSRATPTEASWSPPPRAPWHLRERADEDPRPRPVGARHRAAVRPPRNGSLRLSAAHRGAARAEPVERARPVAR